MSHEYYGYVRSNDHEQVHTWQITRDPDDMLLPLGRFIAPVSFDETGVRAAFEEQYPAIGGKSAVEVPSYQNPVTEVTAYYGNVIRSKGWASGVVEDLAEYTGPSPVLIVCDGIAPALIDVYMESGYARLPYVIRAASDGYGCLTAERAPDAVEKRKKRREAVGRRKRTKEEAASKEYKERKERTDREYSANRTHDEALTAAVAILNSCPPLSVCGHLSVNRATVPNGWYPKRSAFYQLRAAVTVYRRLVGGKGWYDFPAVREAATTLKRYDHLIGGADDQTVKFYEKCPDARTEDEDALKWWRREAKTVLKRLAAETATPVATP